ncbi:MAG: hypothetical protein DI551_06700 [Micavibrio aeruginosavorus]|uniref:Uncharacterized protein n=1 Tax=Micavibrio aeruginosavorus TaxID=349221 RepID=A0A2W5PTD3_9BACT|nr:MAG: hypothetical protein DI551_06700 [Micavibrio aeruginosavorus]
MLQRGFWLYVWKVETPKGERLYVGRTGDSSSPNATAPYTRMGQHLGFAKNQNALRKHLMDAGVFPEECKSFHLISHGPIYPEITKDEDSDRHDLMVAHKPLRDLVAAMEKALADELRLAGYHVMNTVNCRQSYDGTVWLAVREAFAEYFPMMKKACFKPSP